MEEFGTGTQCEVIAQRDLFGMIQTHLLESQVVEAHFRLAHDESGLWTVAQYAGGQPDGGKGAGGATLVAHLASEQNAPDGAETLVVRDGSGGGVGEIRRRSRLHPTAGWCGSRPKSAGPISSRQAPSAHPMDAAKYRVKKRSNPPGHAAAW